MTNLELWAWGANNYGQLANGCPCEQLERPTLVSGPLLGSNARLVPGGGHTLLLNETRLYAAGWNNKGQCGIGNLLDQCQFRELLFDHEVAQVAAGWDFTLAVDCEGQVFACGSNSFGQLGLGKDVKSTSVLTKVQGLCNVVKVAAGMRHSLMLLRDGTLMACGQSKNGQLCGQAVDSNSVLEPIKITADLGAKVVDIKCGQNFSLVVLEDGSLKAFGHDKHGQVTKLNNLPDNLSLNQVEVGWTHALLLHADGQLEALGRSDYGQTAYSSKIKFAKISSGYEHGLGIDFENRLYSWGWNEHGNCGLGHTDNVIEPHLVDIESKKVVDCFAGSGHSFALVE